MRIRSIKPEFWRSKDIDPNDIQQFKEFGTAGPGREFLYLLFDAEYRLLYVGITWKPFDRWRSHRKRHAWWEQVTHAEVWLCEDELHARHWETWSIRNLSPLHNKHQNWRWHRGTHSDDQA